MPPGSQTNQECGRRPRALSSYARYPLDSRTTTARALLRPRKNGVAPRFVDPRHRFGIQPRTSRERSTP